MIEDTHNPEGIVEDEPGHAVECLPDAVSATDATFG